MVLKQSAVFTLWEDVIYKCHSLSCHEKKILFSVKSEILQHNNKLMCDEHSKFDRIQALLLNLLKLHGDQHMTLCPQKKDFYVQVQYLHRSLTCANI